MIDSTAMQFTRADGPGCDYDWFAVDISGYLIHFASGGGFLPESVAVSAENLLTLKQFFDTLPEISADKEISLTSAAVGNSSSFLHFVKRGFYSFDKTDLNNPDDPFYHLIAQPPHAALAVELPANIALLLAPIRLPVSVANLLVIDIATIS